MAKTITFTILDTPENLAAVPAAGGGLAADTTYYYRVMAVDADRHDYPYGQTQSALCAAVSALTTDANKTIDLTWDAVASANYYRVLRTTDPGNWGADGTHTRIYLSGNWLGTSTTNINSYSDDGTDPLWEPEHVQVSTKSLPGGVAANTGVGQLTMSGGTSGDPITLDDINTQIVADGNGAYVYWDGLLFVLMGHWQQYTGLELHFKAIDATIVLFGYNRWGSSHASSIIQLGEYDDTNKYTYDGCRLMHFGSLRFLNYIYAHTYLYDTQVLRTASPNFNEPGAISAGEFNPSGGTYKHVWFDQPGITARGVLSLSDVIFNYGSAVGTTHSINWSNITIRQGYLRLAYGSGLSLLIDTISIDRGGNNHHYHAYSTHNPVITDPTFLTKEVKEAGNVPIIYWSTLDYDYYLDVKYRFDLSVVDEDGGGIAGVTVKIEDVDGGEIAGSPFTTDANGDIAQQIIFAVRYSHKAGTGTGTGPDFTTITSYTPHTVTISKAGYIIRTVVYDMDRKREEIEELLPKRMKKDIEGRLYAEINSVGDLLRIA